MQSDYYLVWISTYMERKQTKYLIQLISHFLVIHMSHGCDLLAALMLFSIMFVNHLINLCSLSFDYAVWIRVPQSLKTAVEAENYSFCGGLHAAGHELLHIVPVYIICNSFDLASECVNPNETRYSRERILLYDSHPGGTRISAQGKDRKK
ncbi:hypothetical protein OSB04_003399 [Centaurea solstitialis]|uniref:MrfA-like Zn-binding domain-containing protein n=1 Tax=Centaurea solstitialis TaxID=347529 RepID=A0AA38TUS9_9ASTR|nr:hypothetical protein OSB04_003399 [Centaurea solstitialis]